MAVEPTAPTCPLHDGRTVRRRCPACDRPACDLCLGVSAERGCPWCGAASARVGELPWSPQSAAADGAPTQPPDPSRHPDTAGSGHGEPSPAATSAGATAAQRRAPVTFGLLTAYVVVFGVEALLGGAAPLTLLGAQVNALVLAGEWWRVLTATVLHAGITHLAFNGYALYILGPQLERSIGSLAFAALYLAAGLAGGIAFLVATPGRSAVGASGAIFGLFGAYLAAAWVNRDTPAGRAGLSQLGVLLAINMALPLFVPGIAWQAHMGGLVTGVLVGVPWATGRRRRVRGSSVAMVAVPVTVAVALLTGLLWYT